MFFPYNENFSPLPPYIRVFLLPDIIYYYVPLIWRIYWFVTSYLLNVQELML